MKTDKACFFSLTLFVFLVCQVNESGAQNYISKTAMSEWVFPNPQGKLHYKILPQGDRIMDFSYAGYRGGGVQIPDPPIKISLKPKEGDNTDVIQAAINELAGLEPVNGFRGTILLAPGRYDCERTITINHSGIVLRGSGSGENGTVFNLTGKAHVCISIRGSVSSRTMGQPTYFSEAYVPSGTTHFSVKDISGLSVGDTIRISKPVTASWIRLMGMDTGF